MLVDPAGIERVLDDSRNYTRKTQSNGAVAIVNDAGDEVVVADGSKVSFTDAEGHQVVADVASGVTTVADDEGSFGSEEVELDDNATSASAEAAPADSSENAHEPQGTSSTPLSPAIAGVIAVAIVAAGGIAFWMRRKR